MRIFIIQRFILCFFILTGISAFAQPGNDTPCAAEVIAVDGGIITGDNTGATADANEIVPPPGMPPEPCYTAWCDGDPDVQTSIWYTFVAPANGAVNITTCLEGTSLDTQIAVWETTDCADYGSYTYFGANDDMPDPCTLGNQYASTLAVDGLIPGNTYYLQVDSYDGTTGVIEIEITTGVPTSLVNFMHNSGDAMLATVDIRVNGELVADDLAFQTCTGYISIPADVDAYVTVNPSTSVDDSAPIFSMNTTLMSALNYVAALTGIASETGYNPAPPVDIAFYAGAELNAANPGDMAIMFQHGITDAPANIDVFDANGALMLNDNLAYNGFSAEGFVNMTAQNMTITTTDGTNDLNLTFCAPFNSVGQFQVAFVLAYSGFVDPANNSDGVAAGLYAVNHIDGTFMPLIPGPCPIPDNDDICNATTLVVNDTPTDFDNTFASIQPGESSPANLNNNDPEADCLTQWCDGVLNGSLWYSFVAPSSGSVIVTTCFDVTFDTQVAVCTVGNCADFNTVTYIGQNDDMENGCTGGDQYASNLVLNGLTPGTTYYVQVDGWEGATGLSSIQVLDNSSVAVINSTSLKVYPVPASEQIRIDGIRGTASVQITDMTGKAILQSNYQQGSSIDIKSLSPGIYHVVVSTPTGLQSLRMIKE
ncbi:MAG: T9SS type A sorting domain-containing protein [Flavobacteriales bacterium]|nr:T9SS type A sorting domain-containing protein [Flavobacteriales bacterium]